METKGAPVFIRYRGHVTPPVVGQRGFGVRTVHPSLVRKGQPASWRVCVSNDTSLLVDLPGNTASRIVIDNFRDMTESIRNLPQIALAIVTGPQCPTRILVAISVRK